MSADTKGKLSRCDESHDNPRDPAGIRTQDPYIKSVLLYQLSYGIIAFFRKTIQTSFVFIEMFSLIAVQNYDFKKHHASILSKKNHIFFIFKP